MGKEELTILRNSAPTFVFTFWLKGGVKPVSFLRSVSLPRGAGGGRGVVLQLVLVPGLVQGFLVLGGCRDKNSFI